MMSVIVRLILIILISGCHTDYTHHYEYYRKVDRKMAKEDPIHFCTVRGFWNSSSQLNNCHHKFSEDYPLEKPEEFCKEKGFVLTSINNN